MLQLTAAAKINLTLRVRGRRADGYHLLESLVAFADIGDRLVLQPAETTAFAVDGPFAAPLQPGDNLVLQALAALEEAAGRALPSDIRLTKNLPVAAGLGGGSADAAAALRGLARLHKLDLSAAELAAAAASLGADVPVCLSPQPAWMTGIGHDVQRLPDLPPLDVVLVNPRMALPTGPVFAALQASSDMAAETAPPQWSAAGDVIDACAAVGNDLQAPAVALVPQIADCLTVLQQSGAAYAAMSGSGASCFGLAAAGAGEALAEAYAAQRPADWVSAGRLIGAGDAEIDQL